MEFFCWLLLFVACIAHPCCFDCCFVFLSILVIMVDGWRYAADEDSPVGTPKEKNEADVRITNRTPTDISSHPT